MPLLIAKAKACAIGDPLDQKTSFGPLISAVQRDKVLSYIQSGIDQGATIATGGKRWGDKGFFIEPTIITDTKDDMKCFKGSHFTPPVSRIFSLIGAER
jgi:aldehyde dehydrogenase (NAD+)